MKTIIFTSIIYLFSLVASTPLVPDTNSLSVRDSGSLAARSDLFKRKGGGGRGGGSSSGGSGGRPASYSSGSNSGGRTRDGSGTKPTYGNRYTGGATVPYTSGSRSPSLGVLPFILPVAALGVFPGLWLYGSPWAYPWGIPYYWHDRNGRNQTSNVTCVCQQYSVCGCDPDNNSTFLQTVVGNGTDSPVNTTLVRTVQWDNGTYSTYINGTLDNGTTAAGGTDPSNEDEEDGAALLRAMSIGGYWLMATIVAAGVML